MKSEQILPQLDLDVLKDKATEYAMQGAMDCIKEYYTGYKSPFKQAINEELQQQETSFTMALPDILALINSSLTAEIEKIANTAVAKTYVPMVQRFLTREEKEIGFSDILRQFIKATEAKNEEDCEVRIEESSHGWLNVSLTSEKSSHEITLHKDYQSEKEGVKKYQVLSLPWKADKYGVSSNMKVSLDGVTLEMPFTRDVLADDFTAYIARLVIGKCLITMDCTDFRDDMFPEDEHCHC